MLFIKRRDYLNMIAYAEQGLPNEVCGLLGGLIDGDIKIVKKYII